MRQSGGVELKVDLAAQTMSSSIHICVKCFVNYANRAGRVLGDRVRAGGTLSEKRRNNSCRQ